jgi:hypothetical protein
MPDLPDRPDLGQLRRQARDLQRRAAAGDADALHQVRSVAKSVTLSAAQLAIARDHGFATWPRLKAEVERRRAAVNAAERAGAVAPPAPLLDSWRNLPADQLDLVRGQYADRPACGPYWRQSWPRRPGSGRPRSSSAGPSSGWSTSTPH